MIEQHAERGPPRRHRRRVGEEARRRVRTVVDPEDRIGPLRRVEGILNLVDDAAARSGVVACKEIRPIASVIGGFEPPDRAVNTRAEPPTRPR